MTTSPGLGTDSIIYFHTCVFPKPFICGQSGTKLKQNAVIYTLKIDASTSRLGGVSSEHTSYNIMHQWQHQQQQHKRSRLDPDTSETKRSVIVYPRDEKHVTFGGLADITHHMNSIMRTAAQKQQQAPPDMDVPRGPFEKKEGEGGGRAT